MHRTDAQERIIIRSLWEIFKVSTRLGLTSFGGPIAHLGYFHEEYVRRKKWLDERSYADLVALAQFLPGPASSQVGIGIGIVRSGLLGGIISWLGFTLPSVIALVLFALVMQGFDIGHAGWIHGLKIVAVAIVAHAVLGMGQKLAADRTRATIAVLAAGTTLLWPAAYTQLLIIGIAGIVGLWLFRKASEGESTAMRIPIGKTTAIVCLSLFFILLIALPIARQFIAAPSVALFDSFYRSGSLVFGGGHVVLPLIERELVPTGWISAEDFLAGYGATQAVPGPLFTFAGYLGAVISGVGGAIVATVAIFLPAFLLIAGTLPFWNTLRQSKKFQGVLIGINAAVVGILVAALYDPIWTSSILQPADFVLAAILFVMLLIWKLPPWIVVLAGAAGGACISALL